MDKGAFQQTFQVPEDIFFESSGGFEKALRANSSNEGLSDTIELPEDHSDTFELFHYWAYSQCMHNDESIAVDTAVSVLDDPGLDNFVTLLELGKFAGKYHIPLLRNQTIKKLAPMLLSDRFEKDRASLLVPETTEVREQRLETRK